MTTTCSQSASLAPISPQADSGDAAAGPAGHPSEQEEEEEDISLDYSDMEDEREHDDGVSQLSPGPSQLEVRESCTMQREMQCAEDASIGNERRDGASQLSPGSSQPEVGQSFTVEHHGDVLRCKHRE